MKKSKKMPVKLLSAVIGLGVLTSIPLEKSFAEDLSEEKLELIATEDEINEESLAYEISDNKLEEMDEELIDKNEEYDTIVTETSQIKQSPKVLAENKEDEEVDIEKITDEQINKIFDSLTFLSAEEKKSYIELIRGYIKEENFAKAKAEIKNAKDRNQELADLEAYEKTIPAYRENIEDEEASYTVIKSDEMKVKIDSKFPRVKEYKIGDKTLPGEENFIDKLFINNIEVRPDVKSTKEAPNSIMYQMKAKDEENLIDAEIDVRLSIINKILDFSVIRVQNNNNIKDGEIIDDPRLLLQTIDFRGNNLVSISSKAKEPKFDGAQMNNNVRLKGDTHIDLTKEVDNWDRENSGYMYGFVSDEKLAAGVWSNSQYDKKARGKGSYTRLKANKQEIADNTYIGIAPNAFYYQRAYEIKDDKGKAIGKYKVYDKRTWYELPRAKVILTTDRNDDEKIDWQDGAIAYREIMNNPMGSDYVKDLVAQRISMNFGSQAQNPFLMTLDNLKKVYLHTDGLGQMILLKGYGSEGHDSGHLNYADIGKRMGGPKDMKYLLEHGLDYGARMGIHVNASETYPESKYFNPERLRKDGNGEFKYGWNWIDQAILIDSKYDLSDKRYNRFNDLHKVLDTDALDFVYIDVWGQYEDDRAWETHVISREVMDNGWRPGFEWGYAGEYDSTFQHWAADLTYGGYKNKGINSEITRFIRNHQKDSWVGNFPDYGGAAVNPLLGGYDMKDFEGWQGRSNYNDFIQTIYKTNLPSKFIQHFEVYNWENGKAVKMTSEDGDYTWTPEMYIRLVGDAGNLEIKRLSNDIESPLYQQREMYLNGRKIYNGDGSYLIPWYNDMNGNKLAKEEEKMYFYNPVGGIITFEMPEDWPGNVYVYRLTDLGRVEEKEYEIKDGKLSLNSNENTPYVVYRIRKEQSDEQTKNITWSDGMSIYDTGFNSGNLDHWNIKGDNDKIKIERSQADNPMLMIRGNETKVNLSQKIKGLKANTSYALYLGVDNRSDAKASISVNTGYNTVSNYTRKSIARNYVQAYEHNTKEKNATVDNASYFQNMYVFFTTGENVDDVTLSIERDAGDEATYFDGLRIVENDSKLFAGNSETNYDKFFYNDFENQVQGIFPFVIGSVEGVTDNRTHLSEKHEPYTQRGWNGKVISDVIGGKWSLKTNGLVERGDLLYQTIPQNYRFEHGKIYDIYFNYEAGSDGTYAFIIGSGDWSNEENRQNAKIYPLENSWEGSSRAKIAKFTLEGNEAEDLWIGILSTDKPADTKDDKDAKATFKGYSDFILDNILIKQIGINPNVEKYRLEMEAAKYLLEKFPNTVFPVRDKLSDIALGYNTNENLV